MRAKSFSVACLALLVACGESGPGEREGGAGSAGDVSDGSGAVAGSTAGSSGAGVASGSGGVAGEGGGVANAGGSSAAAGSSAAGSSAAAGSAAAAGAGAGSGASSGAGGLPEPGSRAAERTTLDAELATLKDLDATTLRERYPTKFEPAPTYEASAVAGLDLIQASALALSDAEQQALLAKGFVISGTRAFPTFTYGYTSIYAEDLPVYISADSILETVHRSYDRVLSTLESGTLRNRLWDLLAGMRARLEGGVGAELGAEVRADADVFLAVAASLLEGTTLAPVAGGSGETIAKLVSLANAAEGTTTIDLFGVQRANEDFSQFEPRGHYTDSPLLASYFKAMMWLGRVDFRLFETQSDGARVFRRRQLEGMLLLHALIDDELAAHFDAIDTALRVLVGEPDYMELSEVPALLADAGVADLAAVPAVSDETFLQALLDGGYGMQRISSHVMMSGLDSGTLPLSVSFALLGQRYTIDSHVFSNVVFDRVGGGAIERMLPNPLDVAFSVLQNDQAAALLAPDLEAYGYAPDLASMRVLADHHPAEFWTDNFYNLWLETLRELSPAAIAKSEDSDALPPTFRSEAWGRRLLTAQLASWAELRHDTLLYAKQSYTGGSTCEFPDGYVDPYPEFYAKLMEYASRGLDLLVPVAKDSFVGTQLERYFGNLLDVATKLHDMAAHQRTGAPYTQEMLDFLNDAVAIQLACGTDRPVGWYARLFFSSDDAIEWAPTIADVHTQPFAPGGAEVGNVLHVGTGDARFMVVVADTCSGPRAYAGLASSYHELLTSNYERLDDPAWEEIVRSQPDVPWAADLVTR